MPDAGAAAELRAARAAPNLSRAFKSWEGLLERLPIGVYVCDRAGRLIHYNKRASQLWGQTPNLDGEGRLFCGALRAFHADGSPMTLEQSAMAEVLATGLAVSDREVIVERADGSRRYLLANAEPLFDDDGTLAGAVNCVQDVTELRQARNQLRARQGWSQRVLEASPVAVYSTDAQGVLINFNRAAAVLWGREPTIGVDRWCGSHLLFHPDGRSMPLDTCSMSQAIRERRQIEGGEAIFERPDGSRGAFLAYPTPLIDADGELLGAISLLVDITERKQAEDRQKTLLDELNHRVKNTLATVQSLAVHSFGGDADPADMRAAFEARLMALSHAHNQLAERHWAEADLAIICEGVLAPFASGRSDHVRLEGGATPLPARAAVVLAMALHELATNAAKFGALSIPAGHLAVSWRLEGGTLRLDWRETEGPQVTAPNRRGFGSRFIHGAVERELGGQVRLDFAAAGLSCTIEAPISVTTL
jgi:PAS domain S-box-containing protein